jgi:AcrR family transcriptional regulator
VGNRERIVEASLQLFNERGTRSVTTNHIAAHLSISPGNLYYHFGNKEEIIRAIYPGFAEAALAAIAFSEEGEITAGEVGRDHLAGIEALWGFRFLFRESHELVARDPALAESMRGLQKTLVQRYLGLFERLIAQGQMRRPGPPEDLLRVATNAFLLWSTWLNFVMTSRPQADLEPRDVAEGALQSFLTFAPYLDEAFAAEVRAVIVEQAPRSGARSEPQG